jgi:hypothetical protein
MPTPGEYKTGLGREGWGHSEFVPGPIGDSGASFTPNRICFLHNPIAATIAQRLELQVPLWVAIAAMPSDKAFLERSQRPEITRDCR